MQTVQEYCPFLMTGTKLFPYVRNDRDDLQEGGLYMYILEIGEENKKGAVVLAK